MDRTAEGAFELRRLEVGSGTARELIEALDRELRERYPEAGTDAHFRLEPAEVEPGQGAFLVAFVDGRPVGCGAVRRFDTSTAEIKRMYVAPQARGRGIGRRILEALEAEARALGARQVLLECGPRQPEALALYARAGYATADAFGEYTTSPLSSFLGKPLRT